MRRSMIYMMVLCLALTGCATSQRVLCKISIDMTKNDVIKKIGFPKVVRDAVKNKSGQTVEIWEYELSTRKAGEFYRDLLFTAGTAGLLAPITLERSKDQVQNYWLCFYENKLVRWGQAGDQTGEWLKEYLDKGNLAEENTQKEVAP